jgi:hypothetical protein
MDSQMEREENEDIKRKGRENRMHCASGARMAMMKDRKKGRPKKQIKEERKSEQSDADSEFDYRSRKQKMKPVQQGF